MPIHPSGIIPKATGITFWTMMTVLFLLTSSLLVGGMVGGANLREGSGGRSDELNATLTFNAAGSDHSATISLPAYANVTHLSLNISGRSLSAGTTELPYNVSLCMGNTATTGDFHYPDSLGYIDGFGSAKSTTILFDTPEKSNADVSISLPATSHVTKASLDVLGQGSNFNGSLFVNIDYVECIRTDPNGDVWYGTSGGAVLRKADGTRTVLTVSSGLPDPRVTDIAIDTNKVYIATKGGVSIFDKSIGEIEAGSWTTELRSTDVTAVAVDSSYVYVGSLDSVDRYNKGGSTFDARWNRSNGDLTPVGTITDLYVDGSGLYVGHSSGGVSHTSTPASPTWNTITTPDLIHHGITCLGGDDSFIFFGTQFGATVYNKTSTTYTNIDNASSHLIRNDITAIHSDTANIYLITSAGASIFSRSDLSMEMCRLTNAWLGVNELRDVSPGSITYFASYGNGIVPYNTTSGATGAPWLTGNGPLQNTIRHIEYFPSQTQGVGSAIYFSTDVGISIFNEQTNLFDDPLTYADGLPGGYGILCTYGDTSSNILYIGTSGMGVYRYDIKNSIFLSSWTQSTASVKLGSNIVNFISEDSGNLYIGTTGGLDIYNKGSSGWTHWTTADGLVSNYCKSFAASTTKLFIGSPFGLTVYDKGGGTFDVWDTSDGLPANDITSLIVTGTTVYIGTYAGVAYTTLSGTVNGIWNVSNGDLPSDTVSYLYHDTNHVYLCTALGVERYNTTTSAFETAKWNTANKRLPSDFVYTMDTDATNSVLYLGTMGGIARYDLGTEMFLPLSSAVNTHPRDPALYIDSDTTPEWSVADYLETRVTTPDLASAFNSYLTGAPVDHYDSYGNAFINVSLNFSVAPSSVGALKLDALDLEFTCTLGTGDLSDGANTYLAAHRNEADAGGNVTIPISVSSDGPGKVILNGLSVSHSFIARPPRSHISSPPTYSRWSLMDTISFDASNSTDPDNDITAYSWSSNISGQIVPPEGDGASFDIPASDIGIGNHTITLTVTDLMLNINTTTVIIEVVEGEVTKPGTPVALITSPGKIAYALVGEIITLNGSASYDPDNDTLSYTWTSTKDGILGHSAITEVGLSDGVHLVTLMVEDPEGLNDTASITVVVNSSRMDVFSADLLDDASRTTTITIRVLHQFPGYTMSILRTSTPSDLPTGLVDMGLFFNVSSEIPTYAWAHMTVDYSGALDPVTGTITGISSIDTLELYSFDSGSYGPVPDQINDPVGMTLSFNTTEELGTYGIFGSRSSGGVGGGGNTNISIPPRVLSVSPDNGAVDVPVNSVITATFDQAMLDDYFTPDTFVIKVERTGQLVEGTMEYNPTGTDLTVRFTSLSPLDYSETYIITITSNVRNSNGDRLDGNGNGIGGESNDSYTWSFNTEAVPGTSGDHGGGTGLFSGAVTWIVFALIIVLALGLGGLAIFMFLKDRKKEADYEESLENAKDEQIITCNSCGAENDSNARVCANCGARIGEYKEAPATAGTAADTDAVPDTETTPGPGLAEAATCPTCGAEIPAGASSCPACGEDDLTLIEGAVFTEEEHTEPVPLLCPTCGSTIPAGENLCPACGEDDLTSARPVEEPSQPAETAELPQD